MELTRIYPQPMSAKAVKANLSSFACEECGTHASRAEEERAITHGLAETIYCMSCESIQEIAVTVEPKSVHLLNESNAKTQIWYHATNVEDWFTKVTTGYKMLDGEFIYAHVGTEEAARDIAKAKYFDYGVSEEVYLYQVTLCEETSVADYISDDEMIWDGFDVAHEESIEAAGADAVRYLNRWEAPGSISLLVNASMLEFVAVETITA